MSSTSTSRGGPDLGFDLLSAFFSITSGSDFEVIYTRSQQPIVKANNSHQNPTEIHENHQKQAIKNQPTCRPPKAKSHNQKVSKGKEQKPKATEAGEATPRATKKQHMPPKVRYPTIHTPPNQQKKRKSNPRNKCPSPFAVRTFHHRPSTFVISRSSRLIDPVAPGSRSCKAGAHAPSVPSRSGVGTWDTATMAQR